MVSWTRWNIIVEENIKKKSSLKIFLTNKMHRFKLSKHFHVRLKSKKEKEKTTLTYRKFVES